MTDKPVVKKGGPRKQEVDLKQVEELAALGLTKEQVAYNIGMRPETFYRKCSKHELIDQAYKTGKNRGIAFVTNKLMEHVKKGSLSATIFYLKCRADWRDNVTVIEEKNPRQQFSELSPEQKLERIRENQKALKEMENALKRKVKGETVEVDQ